MNLGISLKGQSEDNLFKDKKKKKTPKPTKYTQREQMSLYVGNKKNSTLESGTICKNHQLQSKIT